MPLSASSNEDYNSHHPTTTRRSLLSHIATVTATTTMILLPSSAALAEFGQATTMAPPGLVPSPIRPSGEMAKTCEIVALGREDVCLKSLKLPSTYDKVLIGRTLDKLEGSSGGDGGRVAVAALLRSLAVADWDAFDEVLAKVSGDELSKGGGDQDPVTTRTEGDANTKAKLLDPSDDSAPTEHDALGEE